ncbi:hypothetical protein KBD11_02850 [Candidatus Saccharibacteria bacterium]|nr:hypothetical protein [Candidatus Saccharibacteria bacterium]
MKSVNSSTPALVGALSVASIVGATIYVVAQPNPATGPGTRSPDTSTATTAQTPDAPNTSNADSAATHTSATPQASSSFKDGSYNASVQYEVPKGFTNDIDVKLTLSGGTVSAVHVTDSFSGADRESAEYIDAFEANIESAIVGKSIGDVALSRVGGASLTTQGFNEALADIANQAKA